jgi:GAF domain-containing protein
VVSEAVREAEILRSGVLFVGADPRLFAIVQKARERFGTASAALTIVHNQWQHVIAGVGTVPGTYPRSASFCTHAIEHEPRVFCVSDAAADPRFVDHPNVRGGALIRFYAGSPLMSGGVALGALCIFGPLARPCLPANEEAELEAMAADAMETISVVARGRVGNA